METHETSEYTCNFDDSEEAKNHIYAKLLDWFQKHELYTGEAIVQSDIAQIEAPDLMAFLAEEGFKFDVTWKEN